MRDPAPPPAHVAKTPTDDIQLLASCRAGHPGAAEALYERAHPIVGRTIARLLGATDQDGQDIAQMAMVELVRSIGRYRGDCPFDSWVSTVTAHLVYKQIRRRQLERRVFADRLVTTEEPAGLRPTPAREVVVRGLCSQVIRHLEAMPPKRAWAVALHDIHGYDIKEIAAIMGSSHAAAQGRLSRGRRQLNDRIRGDAELAGALELLEEESR